MTDSFDDGDPRTARILESFGAQSMMSTLGAEIVHVAPGLCRVRAPILAGARQQQGYGHAALTFALGDTAAGYAALTMMDESHEVLTAEIKMNLLAPAQGECLVAEGRVIRPGRRLVVVQSEVWAENGGNRRQVAVLLGTMVPVPA